MKRVSLFSVIILLVMTGCGGNKQSTDDFITVDVTQRYPQKELILQDFMDVEYIVLETNEDFITQGVVMDDGKEIIVVRNRVQDGYILIFDRKTGKGLRKINRRGQGPEEYIVYLSGGFFLDEENAEIFVNDGIRFSFIVYDLYGNFKRKIRYEEGVFILNSFNYDKNNIICEEMDPLDSSFDGLNPFYLISKQDGSTKSLKIHFTKYIPTQLMIKNEDGIPIGGSSTLNCLIVPFQNDLVLTQPSSDTVFRYLPDHTMLPFIVRTPSIQSMNPEIFLFPGVLTDRYYFMQSVKKVYDFTKQEGFPTIDLVYDKYEKMIYNIIVYNGDYSKKTVDMAMRAVNNETFHVTLEAYELVEAYKKGELKGRLKEIASGLDVEDNPVIMLVKHKK